MNNIPEKISLTLILLKIFYIYLIYHLIVKDKVAEQHILGKYCNCNSFGVTMALLNSQNFKVAITQLSNMQ